MKRFFHPIGGCFFAILAMASSIAGAEPRAAVLDQTHSRLKPVLALQSAVTPDLMQWPDVLGSAVGLNEAGQPALLVFVDRDGPSHKEFVQAMPAVLRGIPIRLEVTDKIRAFAGKPSGGDRGISHTARQTTPIYLGTSGGWRYDLANGYCCGGTLGSLIQVNGVQFILS